MVKTVEGYAKKAKGSHKSNKTGNYVNVERIENGGFVVRNMKGKILKYYEKSEMNLFNKRYKSVPR